jgi:hypothetical protein
MLSPEDALPPCDRRIAELHRYWLSIRPARGRLPGRRHFDPVAVPRLLPWIFLLDVERAPLRFRYRLVGSEEVAALGCDPTGRWCDELVADFAAAPTYPQWVATAEEGRIAYHHGLPVVHVPKDYISTERLLLPLARDGERVDMILAIAVFHRASRA